MAATSTAMSANTKIVGGAALAFLTYSYAKKYWMKAHPNSGTLQEIDDMDDGVDPTSDEFIQPEDIVAVFDRLFTEMSSVVAQLSQQIQQIQMSGQQIPPAQLQKIMSGEFERVLIIKQQQVYEAAKLEASCVEEATWEFMKKPDEYPKVVKSIQRFQRMWENISGEKCVGILPGQKGAEDDIEVLSPSETVEVAKVFFGALTEAMKGIVEDFKAQGKDLQDPTTAQQVQMKFASVADSAGAEALEKIGSSQDQFQKSVQANSSDPSVGRALAMLQMQQQQDMMKLGLA